MNEYCSLNRGKRKQKQHRQQQQYNSKIYLNAKANANVPLYIYLFICEENKHTLPAGWREKEREWIHSRNGFFLIHILQYSVYMRAYVFFCSWSSVFFRVSEKHCRYTKSSRWKKGREKIKSSKTSYMKIGTK